MHCLFLTSGHGGDYFAVEKARHAGVLDVGSISVASTSPTSPCLKDAAQKGYWTEQFSLTKEERKNKLGEKLLDLFSRVDFDICFLAGFHSRRRVPIDFNWRPYQFLLQIFNSKHCVVNTGRLIRGYGQLACLDQIVHLLNQIMHGVRAQII